MFLFWGSSTDPRPEETRAASKTLDIPPQGGVSQPCTFSASNTISKLRKACLFLSEGINTGFGQQVSREHPQGVPGRTEIEPHNPCSPVSRYLKAHLHLLPSWKEFQVILETSLDLHRCLHICSCSIPTSALSLFG